MRVLMFFTMGFSFSLLFALSEFSVPVLCIIFILLNVVIFIKNKEPAPLKSWVISGVGVIFSIIYLQTYTYLKIEPLAQYHNSTIEGTALVLEFPEKGSYSYSVLCDLTLTSGEVVETVIYTDEQVEELKPGDQFQGSFLVTLSNETYSGVAISYYMERGIFLRGQTMGELNVTTESGVKLRHIPIYMAEALKNGIYNSFEEPYAGVVRALVTGNKEDLTDEFKSGLSRTGLSHTVAVSGMHLSFLASVLWIFLPAGHGLSLFSFSIAMILFMLVSGSTPSIVRATVMILMLYIAPLFGRCRDDATALSVAILCILFQNPYAVTQVGFQLSVASVISIYTFGGSIREYLLTFFGEIEKEWIQNLRKVFASAVGTTLSAMVLTTPLVAYYFGSVSLIAPLANFFAIWLVSFSFAGGLITGVTAVFLPFLADILGFIVTTPIELLMKLVIFLGHRPFAAIQLDSMYYIVWLCFAYLMFAFYYFYWGEKRPFIPILSSVLTFGLVAVIHSETNLAHDVSAQVLNVGQGQSALFTIGNRFVVSDCGGNAYENAGDMVADVVNDLGRNYIDFLVLSHCDADHANGVEQLLNRVKVGNIVMPPADPEHPLQQSIILKAGETGTNVIYVEEFTEYYMGEQLKMTLYPPVASGSTNESGIILMLSAGEKDILITGDIGSQTETALHIAYTLPDIEILFVGHHGSRFSTGTILLDKATPEIAIISVGLNNSYGHPSSEVLQKLEDRDITVYRTDLQGTVYFNLDV